MRARRVVEAPALEPALMTALSRTFLTVSLASTLTSAQLPQVASDGRRLRQVLLNLLGNACKFTERGEIRVLLEPALR